MAGGKLSPRQKMIGMMYLVLTALLALNISKEIINAFVLINDGIEKTTSNFINKNGVTYASLDKAKMMDPAKVQNFWNKAQAVKKLSSELSGYIDALKKELMSKADKIEDKKEIDTLNLHHVNSKDNADIPGQILIGSTEDGSKGKARELKLKIQEYKKNILAQIKDIKGSDKLNVGLDTSDPPPSVEHGKQNWEVFNFDHTPLAPVIVLLSKLQADVRNAEGDVINFIMNQISADDFKFDTLSAKVIAKTNYVLLGSEYEADVFVAAFSTTQNPRVWLGDVDSTKGEIVGAIDSLSVKVEKGVGKYIIKPSAEGEKKWGGVIKVLSPSGQLKTYPFKSSYIAAKPNMVVSADKMNVLYIGVENPVSISVPGIPAEKVKAAMSNGSLIPKGKGSFIAKVSTPGEALVSVQGEVNGKMQSMGPPVKFRVKRVPDPVAMVAQSKGSKPISKNVLAAQGGVFAELENFDFDLRFNVVSFDLTIAGKGRDVMTEKNSTGAAITPAMRELINRTRLGDKIFFENVKARGPDGTTRSLSAISFTIQ